jgi:hypothetical protein
MLGVNTSTVQLWLVIFLLIVLVVVDTVYFVLHW